jgi:hypothetical protein|tara:strand:- start:3376 stop:3606 length:231 start_codon:yes stop_codon:yes gene_type:complete
VELPEAVLAVQLVLLVVVVMVVPPSPPSLLAVHPASNTEPSISKPHSPPETAEGGFLSGWIIPLSERIMARGTVQI